jgi:membrane-bound lytic murein transglycosylase MltF
MCQPTNDSRFTLSAAVTLFALFLLFLGCGGGPDERSQLYSEGAADEFADPELEPFKGDLSEMRERRLIRALVTPSRTDFFVDSGQIRGIQAEFLQQFAQRLNRGVRDETERIRIKYVPVPFSELIPALLDGRGDVAAAFLTVTEERRTEVTFAAPFRRSVSEVLVTHEGTKVPEDWAGLSGERVYVLRGSAYAEHLRDFNEQLRGEGLEPIEIEEADARLRSEDVLEFVNAGVVERTVIDDYKAELWQKVLPDIRVHDSLALTSGSHVAWAVRPGSRKLKVEIDAFVSTAREGALLGNILLERYFGDVKWLENPNSSSERDKLRRYLDLFREYGDRFGFDPLALAAQAYQESGLDHESRSPAGAVGLMQILPSTAADPNVDVSDIDDPEGNVHAGTKYLAFIRDRYFDEPELSDWDRRALTWAAYNAGPRKIREARALAKRMGLDPDRWFGNVEVAARRAIGREPVRYVDNIYRYYVAYRMSWIHESERREAAEDLG